MFKKKFRSLAIVALSFLMVVSFGVGISTFDTKYTPKAQAATTTIVDFNSDVATTLNLTVNTKSSKLNTSSHKINDNAYIISTNTSSGSNYPYVGSSTYAGSMFSGTNGDVNYHGITIRTGAFLIKTPSAGTVTFNFYANGSSSSAYYFGKHSDQATTPSLTNSNFTALYSGTSAIASTTTGAVSAGSKFSTTGRYSYDYPVSEGAWFKFYSNSSAYLLVESITFTPSTPAATYDVTFNKNAGNDTVSNMPDDASISKIPETEPTRSGYVFKGWSTTESGSATYQAGDAVESALTLFAVWAKAYTVTFNTNDGGSIDSQTIESGNTASAPNEPKKSGYDFGGWFTDEDCTNAFNFSTAITQDYTLYAKWTEEVPDSFTVKFMNNGNVYHTANVTEGNTVDRPDDPTNNSALWFGGWWTKDGTQSSNWGAGGSNRSGLSGWGYVFDFDKELTQDTTVYAMWVNTMDATGFQTYIDGLVRSGLIDPYCKNREKPLWNTEGFKTKWHYIDGVFLNSIVNLYYNASESENITYTSWSGNGGTGEEVTTNKKQFYYDFFTNYVSDYVNDNGGFNTVTQGTGATKSTSLGNTLDNICESKILYDAYVLTGEEKYLKALETTKGILNNMTKVNGSEITIDGVEYYNYSHQNGNDCVNEIWLDGMYMYAPFLARYLKATNASSSEYQELLAQYSFMLKKMRDSDTGLYYHAYAGEGNSDSNWEKGGDKCSPNFWSRGMGWFVTSLIDVIELMPSDVPVAQGIIDRIPSNFSSAYGNTIDTSNGKAFLQSMLKDAIDALLAHQDPNSKMIYEVIDGGITVDGLQNYLESSGSSMVAYAIMKASRLFLNGQNSKDGRSYAVRGREMFEGITAHSLYDNKLHDICKMCDITDNGATVSYYLTNSDTQIVKDESKGSAPYMMAFIEYNALINEKTPTPTKTPDVSKRRLHVNVGSEVYYVEVTKGGTTTLQAVQTALASAGYIGTINSLYTDSNLSSAYGYSAVNEDITLYATYSSGEVQTYTVTFVVDDETVKTQDVNENGYATAPSQPEKSGYVFRGWSADGSAISDVATYAITKDTTFTALWEEESSTKYTVTFDLNGGNIGGETSYSIQVSDGAYATKPTNPTKTGSTFMGWYTSEDKSAKKDEFDFDEETITGELTLHALWFDSVDENAIVSYIQGLMEDTDLTTMDQGKWNTETWRGYFNYVNGIFLNSLVNLSYNTNDANQKAEYQQFVVDYLERYIRQDGTIVQYPSKTAAPDPENASEFTNIVRIDFIQTVRTLFDAYEFSGDERFLKAVEYALDKFASAAKVENTYNNPPHTPSDLNEIWLDGLYMYAPLYARYIAAGGTNSNYSALELFNQYTVVVDNMRDSETGLYYHGYAVDKDTSASPWADPETGLSASFWSRSVGWLAMSLVDVLDYYPEGVSISKSFNGTNYTDARAYLTAVFKDLMDSLLSFQDPDSKMFYQILNHDSIISGVSNDNYLETSGSAMFAYALMKGGKAGYLSGTYTTTYGDTLSYNDIGRQIFEGVYAHSVSVSGSTVNVYDICGATSLSDADSDSMSAYIGNDIVSNESKGTAPIILAFIEYFNEIVNQPETPNVNERKIYLVTNGGTHNLGVDYVTVNINDTLSSSELPELTKADYDFTGWYLDAELTQAFTFNSTILTEETTTLYAGWTLSENAESFEITLDANDGAFSDSQASITATVSQSNPELLSSHIPTRDGYDFGGFADSNGTLYFDANGILCDGVEISGGETLYAVWKKTVTVKLDFSSFIDASAQTTNNNGYNTVFTLKDGTTTKITDTAGHYYYDFSANTVDGFYAPTGERLNYVLIAWVDQDGNEYAPDSLIIPTKDLTLTPIFYVDPDSIGSRVSVSGSTVTWSAYEMSNGKYPESDTNKLYQNIRWTDLYADTKVGDEFTIVSNDLVTIKVDASELTTYGTDNGHRATTEPMIYMQPNMTSSISPVEITVNGSSVTADITIYGFFYKSGRTATLKLYNGDSEIDSVTTGEAGYGGANTITDTVLSGKTPTSGTLTGLESGNTYSLISTGTQNFYISTIVVELSTAPKFTVSFEENGGTSVSDVSNVAVGGKVSAPTAPTKSGFAFDGWYLDSNLTKAYDFNTVVTNDTTLYAKWNATGETPDTYTVTYNANGGENAPTDSTQYSSGDTVTISSTVPTRTNYIFAGWTSSAFSGTKQAGETFTMPENNVTLTASWTATYSVTYVDGVDGEEISMPSNSNRFKEGVTFTISGANPSRLGYTFAGWESSAFDGVKQANASFTMPASDVTLTATWNPITYNIAFNKNNEDATGEMSPIVATYGQATGLTQNGFTLSGYTFLGWATSENGDVVYLNGESVENLANTQDATVTLYAIWQVEGAGNTVTVNYNFSELKDGNTGYNLNNGGNITVDGTTFTGNNHSHIYTKEATGGVLLSSSAVSRVNYNLVGWATTQYGAKVYDAGGTYSGNDAEITLYPVWEISGNTDNRTTTTVNGEIETHVWSAYVVNGAYDANNAESFYYMGTDNGAYKNIRWTDLYKNNVVDGVYTISGGGANDNYSIKVDTNSGASVDADHRMVSEPLIKIDKEANSTTYSPISIIVNNGYTASIKIYAVVYNAASEISILASDKSTSEGSTSVSNRYGYAGDDDHARPNDFVGGVTPNELTVSGLRTGTYYIANTGSNHVYITGIEVNLTPAVPEYNVNFYNNESESDETIFETVLTFGGTLVLPNTDPIREGFRFDGWYTQREGGEKVVEGATISEDTNYYAHWTELPKYSVNFEESYPDGVASGIKNMPSDIVNTTETSITPSSPSLAGYSFLGWSTVSGASVAAYAPGASIDITGNPTLYPVWALATEEYFIIYKNGEQLTIPNSQGIEATFVGLSSMVEERTNIIFGSGDLQTGTVIKTGGSSKSTRYISFKVPSSVYSSFKVKVVGTPSSNGQINIWVSKTIGSSMGNGETAIITPSVSNTYLTGTSGSFDTADENGDDITYYLNFSSGARFYEISLELTTEINTDVERTISFVTDDNDARPFDAAIADQKVENGGSLDLTAIVPTTSSQGYVFSHWVDSLGNVYTTSIDNVLRDMTLYAKWYTVVNSADTPESTRGKVPLADAQVYGLYLPSTTTIRLANGSTASWTVDWDYVNATYATELDGDYTAKNISNYANIDVAGFYKVTGTISVPSGYLYKIGEVETSTITVESIVEVYVIGAQVMAGAGYMSDGRTAWNSGLTLTNDRYTLSENGEVSIVVDADNIGEITSDGIINLTGATFSNSTYKNDAPIKIGLPNEYSMLLIVIKVTNATKDNVSLWTEDGTQVSLSQTVGATYTNLSISTTNNYGNILYLFSSGNNTALHSIVVNAQYEDENINDENIEDSTNKLYYHTVINDNNSYGEAIEEPYNYLNQAKVIVKPQTEHLDLPDHYLFSRWATATSGTASYYNPGDVLSITSETNNLYVIMEEEPKITITFDVNAPAGMEDSQISQVFGSFALEYKIYSGDSLDSMPDFSEVRFTVNDYEYTFDGWSPSITQDTTFNEDTTVTANWYTATLPVIVKDLEKTVQEGTTEAEIINSLPTEFVVCDINGNETSDYDYAVIVGSWTSVAYNANVAGTYLFRATLDTAPSGTVWYSSWAGVEIDSQAYDRSQDGTYYVYCKVTVVEAEDYATYSAEFTAFAYTGSGDHVLYNNNSNTHDKAWSDYYQVATDEATIPGTIVARNGEVKIIADDETIVDEDDGITAALVDTDYHGQTWSMIKGYHQTSNNAPFIYVVVPKGYASVKISVYAVRFRASGNDVTLEVGPLNSGKDNMLVTDHSYTETDNETDFNYFYEFSPSYYIYEYSGDETVFTVRNTHRSTNIYLTGIKVECTMVEDESHIITYHANDGTDNALTREVVYAENGSGDDAIVEKNFFEREGYEFIGWSRTKGAEVIESNYQVGKSLELDGNITLYAVWQRARALTYYANDGSTDSFTKYYTNGRGPLSENEFDMTAETREDKVFLSWNTQSNGQGDTYYPGDIFNPNASDNRLVGVIPEGTVLYAQWGSGKTLTAKWDAYSSELQAIDTVYTDCSQTLGNDWTTKYNGKIIAKNGDVLTVNASGATAGSNAMSKPMLSLAKGNTISVNVSGITTESALSIRVSAVVASGSSKFTINGTEYSVSRTFDDGSTFTPFVADLAVYATTVSEASTINITTTGNSAIYIVGISASVSNDQFVGNTLTYNNNIEGAEETYDYLVSGSTIVDINHFHRDGYTFAGWATTEGGEVAYTYGQELTVSEDITLYAKWTPITYNYEFISNEATHDDGTFNLVDGIAKPSEDPELNGYIFMGWYLDDGVFQNQATFDGENKFYPSFEMIDGDTVYLYAYFIEDIHTKEIVTPNELQDLEKYIVDVMENVYREEGSTSGTAIVSASALELPANVMVTGDGFGKNLAIDWSLAVSGWTLSSLQSGTQTLTGYIKLDDSDYGSFAFSDGVNDNLQQIGVTVDLTLRNIIIQFNDNEPLVVKNFYYPVGTKRSAVVSQFEVRGFYFDRNGLHQEWIPTGLVWATSNYDSEEQGSYSFTTDLYADIGYAFQVKIDDVNEERKTIQATANVTLQGNDSAYSGVGFERKGSSDWTNGVTGDFVIDTNGEVGNRLVLTGLSNSYGNENGYLTLDAGENALKISIPSGTEEVSISYIGGVRTVGESNTFSIVDASGNVLATTGNLGAYQNATINKLTITSDNVDNLSGLTELYVKVNGDEILLSQILVASTPVITMSENVVKLRFVYNGVERYYAIANGDGTISTATKYVKGSKVILPDFDETGLDNRPTAENIEFAGWSNDGSSQVASYMAGGLYDLDTYSDVAVGNDTERVVTLYAVFSIGYHTLTFDSGFGKTVEFKIQIGKTVGEVITIRGVGREQELKDLEESRIGYNFVDWTYNGEIFSSNTLLGSDLVVTATWTPKTYTINYKNGNDIITTDMVTYTEMFSAPVLDKNPDYINTTRTFRTWTYNGTDWDFGQASLESEGIILDNDVYQIDLQADFGAMITFVTEYEEVVGSAFPIVRDSNVYPIGYRYSLQDRVTGLNGYEFMGWSLTQNSPTAEFTTESVIELTENITLYAVWKARNYRITFVSGNDGIEFTDLTVDGVALENNSALFEFNTELPTISASASGYVIHSWYYIDEQGFERTWVFDGDNPNKIMAQDITLYARWGVTVNFEKFSQTVGDTSFNADGATLYNSVVVAIDDAIPFVHTQGTASSGTLHVRPQIPNYSFTGWYKDDQGVSEFEINQAFTIDFINSLKGDDKTVTEVTIYAGFEKVTGNVVITFVDTFDTGATMPVSVQHANSTYFTVTAEYILPDNTVAEFKGWSLYPDGSGEIYGLDDEVFIEGDTVLYAFWTISITDIEIDTPTVRSDETIQVQIPYALDGINGEKVFESVFEIKWKLAEATNADDTSDETIYDLTMGAHNVAAGRYSVPVELVLESGYVWNGSNLELLDNGHYATTIEIIVLNSEVPYYIVKIYSIEDTTALNSDYRLDKVKAEINTNSTADSGTEITLAVTWNSQIDTTVWGTHYVLGSVHAGSYELKVGVSQTVSATIEVTKNGEENAYLYKTYQDGTMPDAPVAPNEFKFLCWTDKGVTAVGQNGTAPAGEWTAMYTKLSFTEGGSIRLNKDYTGIRFTAHLEFYGVNYVAELMKNKSNLSGAVSVTMNFNYEKDGTTYNVGTGQDFMNMTQSVEAGNAIITFSGVISDLIVYDNDGNFVNNDNCDIEFTPIAKVKLNGAEADSLTAGFSVSASHVASAVIGNYAEGTYQHSVLLDYTK